ncbi:MAG: PP2C family protein-serine/threonine phosphatase [Terriglobia bacterium]
MKTFWESVTEGIEIQDLWAQFRAEARASYGFYVKDVDQDWVKGESRFKRRIRIWRLFFWAVLMKLSPSRRLLLLIAVVLFVLALAGVWPLGWPLTVVALFLLLILELADRVAMKRDLEIAREIQGWLVPKEAPQIAGVDIAFATRPQNTVAGDYYDAFLRPAANGAAPGPAGPSPTADNRLLLVVADVAGKSVPAALLMATFQASLRTLAAAPVTFFDLVNRLNGYACAHSLGGLRFTTAFFAELEPTSRALTYINAGHNPPILRRASGEIERLEAGGLPLGIKSDVRYDSDTVALRAGDLLAVFTDGVVEAENENGEEYGESRLLALLTTASAGAAQEQLKRLMASVDAFVGPARQHDDITCLLLRSL